MSIVTIQGRQVEVVVDTTLVRDGHLEVGPLVALQDDRALVELPREAASGSLRVWIPTSDIVGERQAA